MGPLAVKDLPAVITELDSALLRELADIVKEAEQPSEEKGMEIAPWLYFVPCAGVRYYAYHDRPSPVNT